MTDIKRQLEYQTEETETKTPRSEKSLDGGALFISEYNSDFSEVPIYKWDTELGEQKSTDDQYNGKNSTDGKRIEKKAEELKENTDPSPNGQQNTENYKHETAVLFLLK